MLILIRKNYDYNGDYDDQPTALHNHQQPPVFGLNFVIGGHLRVADVVITSFCAVFGIRGVLIFKVPYVQETLSFSSVANILKYQRNIMI